VDPLQRLGALDESEIDILDAGLELAAADYPSRAIDGYRRRVHECVDALYPYSAKAKSPADWARALASVLHGRFGFTGDRETYDAPENANLMDVFDRKRGLPVALSIMYIGVGRALGWEVNGVNMPGHFLIRLGHGPRSVLQDPYGDGKILNLSEAEDLVRRVSGKAARLEPNHLKPLPTRAILIRLLNNLSSRAEAAGDLERALELHERMTMIAPIYTGLWWERARIEQQLGRFGAARGSLSAMLETTRDKVLTRQIRQAITDLARSLN
jgi:regulator of sirC expression with transglutaminase-like and TPR domain